MFHVRKLRAAGPAPRMPALATAMSHRGRRQRDRRTFWQPATTGPDSPALGFARAGRAADLAAHLTAHPEDATTIDKLSRTPLHLAAFSGHEDSVELLLALGANAAAEAQDKVLALHFAAMKGHSGCVRLILEAGAPVDAYAGKKYRTALMMAAEKGHTEACRVLLAHGASKKYRDRGGARASELAGESGYADLATMLLRGAERAVAAADQGSDGGSGSDDDAASAEEDDESSGASPRASSPGGAAAAEAEEASGEAKQVQATGGAAAASPGAPARPGKREREETEADSASIGPATKASSTAGAGPDSASIGPAPKASSIAGAGPE